MTDDEGMLRLLASIDRRLALLTASEERDMQRALAQELLRSGGRTKMFNSIDGRRTSPEIAKAAGVSERAVQLFVKELLDMGLVRDTGAGSGRSVIVEKNEEAIVHWYIGRDAEQ